MLVDEAAVRRQLERILASSGFAGSARLRRFLQYVVERQLAGEAAQLKEFAIGVEVFDRPATYDPRLDSIVRVEAGRLRSKLDEYYAGAGAADEIHIGLPRGSYVPTFSSRGGPSDPTAHAPSEPGASQEAPLQHDASNKMSGRSWRRAATVTVAVSALLILVVVVGWRSLSETPRAVEPGISIAVLPFEEFSGSEADLRLADQLTNDVTLALAKVGTLSVVSRTSAQQFKGVRKPMHEIGDALGAQIIMEAAVELDGDGLLIQPRLVDATIDRKIWVGTYRGSRNDLRGLATNIATGATEAVMKRRSASDPSKR